MNGPCENDKYHGDEDWIDDESDFSVTEYFPVFCEVENKFKQNELKIDLTPTQFQIDMKATDRLAKVIAELKRKNLISEYNNEN